MNELKLKPFDTIYCEHCRKYSRILTINDVVKNGYIEISLECGQTILIGQHPKNKGKL